MKDMIISTKAKEKEILLKGVADITALVEVAQVLSLVDLAGRYNWAMSNADLDIAKKLGLIGIKKY